MSLNIYPEKKDKLVIQHRKLIESTISPKNKEIIEKYEQYLLSKGNVKNERLSKILSQLRNIAELLNKNFDKASKDDLIGLIAKINSGEYFRNKIKNWHNGKIVFTQTKKSHSEETKADYRKRVKTFYKWFKKDDLRIESDDKSERVSMNKFYDYVETEIKTTTKRKNHSYSDVLFDDDIDKVIDSGCKTHKEKAFIKFLHETGVRAGELLTIKLKDIEFKDTHALIKVAGKTGERRVYVLHSLPYLSKWLDIHPYKNDKNAYLWISEDNRFMDNPQPLLYKGGLRIINKCFKRAKIGKKHNYHWFRHSRATLLAPHVKETILCDYMGWEKGGAQVKIYVHSDKSQLENAFSEMNGLIKKEDNKNLPIKCSCTAINDNKSRYCFKCGKPLSVEIALHDEKVFETQTDIALKNFLDMIKNPEILKAFEEFNKTK